MLLQNQTLLAQYPRRGRGGILAGERAMYGRSDRRNIFIGETANQLAGQPPGYLAPGSWNLPNKAGLMTSSGTLALSVGAAIGLQGLGGTADAAAVSVGAAIGVGVAAGVAAGAASSVGSASGVGLANATASGTASSTGAATTTAIASGVAAGAASSSGGATTGAVAWGIAGPVVTELTADAVASAVMDSAVESGLTLTEAMRLVSAALAGKVSGAEGTTVTIRNVGDTKDRIVATVDTNGNRTAITTDLT